MKTPTRENQLLRRIVIRIVIIEAVAAQRYVVCFPIISHLDHSMLKLSQFPTLATVVAA